ncbi:MAG: shikimate dehydrogenase [Acidimicrobiales bacterium]
MYVALPVAAGSGAIALDAMRSLGIDGLSVTMPHKEVVAQNVDRQTEAVTRLRACNCVARDGDMLVGHNTDGAGFVASVAHGAGIDLSGARVAVLGAGGAARAIIHAVGAAGAERVLVINRTQSRAEDAAEASDVAAVGTPDDLAEVDVIVNATAVGMDGGPAPDALPLDPEVLGAQQLVVDIVYQPELTPLLDAAATRGVKTLGGLGMLVHQAALQFELWTGESAPIDVMTAALRTPA